MGACWWEALEALAPTPVLNAFLRGTRRAAAAVLEAAPTADLNHIAFRRSGVLEAARDLRSAQWLVEEAGADPVRTIWTQFNQEVRGNGSTRTACTLRCADRPLTLLRPGFGLSFFLFLCSTADN